VSTLARHVPMGAFTTLLEVLGAVLIVIGCALWWLPVGFVAAGGWCLLFGWQLAPAPPRGDHR
jgi:hypothetical protein